jgi:NADPH-dependent F420 reductase
MIGFIGGTGPEGKGLALRLAMAGQQVIIGSRSGERALEAVAELKIKAPAISILGDENAEVARRADLIFITVPFDGHRVTLQALSDHLADKIVVDVVSNLAFINGHATAMTVPEGSAAEQAQEILPGSSVVSGFHNISAVNLLDPGKNVDGDVIICGDNIEAKKKVMGLAKLIPDLRAINGGGLSNSHYVEEFTALLLNINRIYKAHVGIRIVGI